MVEEVHGGHEAGGEGEGLMFGEIEGKGECDAREDSESRR